MTTEQESVLKSFIPTLSDVVNNMVQDEKEIIDIFVNELRKDHRTLQQKMISVLVHTLVEYGKVASSDLRNEQAVKTCQQIAEKVDIFFPFI